MQFTLLCGKIKKASKRNGFPIGDMQLK